MCSQSVHKSLTDIGTNLTEVLEVTGDILHTIYDGRGHHQGEYTFLNMVTAHGISSYTPIPRVGSFTFSEDGFISYNTIILCGSNSIDKININVLIESEDDGKITEEAWFQYSTVTDNLFGLELRDVQRISDMIKKFRKYSGRTLKQ